MTTFKDLYFSNETETENAVLDFIARGVKFRAVGRTHLIIEVEEETAAETAEASEQTEAANLLEIYVYNDSDIYEKHVTPAVDKVAAMIRSNARSEKGGNWEITPAAISEETHVKKAVSLATRIVRKHDWIEPTYFDKKAVRLSLAAYVIESAQYQVEAV